MNSTMISNNPLFLRAQEMAKGKSEQELEQIARNICEQKGLDYEKMKQLFISKTSSNK